MLRMTVDAIAWIASLSLAMTVSYNLYVKFAHDSKILCVAGTRPEYIKLLPVYKELKKQSANVYWVSSGQHSELVKDLEEFFQVKPDFSLSPNFTKEDTLSQRSCKLQTSISKLFTEEHPDLVIVQGDTMTTYESALSAFFQKIPVAHVEAGLRTDNIMSPYPEEFFRRSISQLSSINFCPTELALKNLEQEKHSNNYLVGNTVIDALKYCYGRIGVETPTRPYVLISSHRTENIERMSSDLVPAINKLAVSHPELDFIIKIHSNPKIEQAFNELNDTKNIKMLGTKTYPDFVKLMAESSLILTDSGGIQEEAPYLNRRVLVFRKETERQEAITTGLLDLIDLDYESIIQAVNSALMQETLKCHFRVELQIFGNGTAALKIVKILDNFLSKTQ